MTAVDIKVPIGIADPVSYVSGVLAERGRCITIAEKEKVDAGATGTPEDNAYNHARDDIKATIKAGGPWIYDASGSAESSGGQ